MTPVEHYDLLDWEWEFFEYVFKSGKAKRERGRPASNHRQVLNGIFWVMMRDTVWREMPKRYGNWNAAARQFSRWSKNGMWHRGLTLLHTHPFYKGLCEPPLRNEQGEPISINHRGEVRSLFPDPSDFAHYRHCVGGEHWMHVLHIRCDLLDSHAYRIAGQIDERDRWRETDEYRFTLLHRQNAFQRSQSSLRFAMSESGRGWIYLEDWRRQGRGLRRGPPPTPDESAEALASLVRQIRSGLPYCEEERLIVKANFKSNKELKDN